MVSAHLDRPVQGLSTAQTKALATAWAAKRADGSPGTTARSSWTPWSTCTPSAAPAGVEVPAVLTPTRQLPAVSGIPWSGGRAGCVPAESGHPEGREVDMNTSAMAQGGRIRARRAARGSVTEGAARAGLAARGVIYLLVGALALQIAFGDTGEQADRGGALAELSQQPFGAVMLWALGIGLVGMALWRLSEILFGSVGPDGRSARKRLLATARFVFYVFVAYSVLSFAANRGRSGSGSSDRQSQDATARALEIPAGQWLVGAAGLAIVVAGGWIGVRAVLRKYHDKLRLGQMSPRTRRLVDVTGVAGGAARGLVFAVAGVFAVRAAIDYEPDRAKGLDDTLRSFADTPLGPWLLVCVAAGLVLFGVFSFAMARWRRV